MIKHFKTALADVHMVICKTVFAKNQHGKHAGNTIN